MTNLDVPHIQWPLKMGGFNSSKILFVEQDSPEEVAQCIGFVYATEPGELATTPTLGLSDPTFTGGVSEAELLAVANRWEPRASLNFTSDTLVDIAQVVGVSVQ